MFTNTALMAETEKLKKFAVRLTKNEVDAEDLVQSTLMRALEKKHLYKKDTNLFGWTSKMMFNIFASNYKRAEKFEDKHDPETIIENESVAASQEIEIRCKEVLQALNQLSVSHRNIVEMTCIQGMSYAEISKASNIPVGTVRSRLSRAREQIEQIVNSVSNQTPGGEKPQSLLQLAA